MPRSSHINEILSRAKKYSQLCEGQNIFYQEEVALIRPEFFLLVEMKSDLGSGDEKNK